MTDEGKPIGWQPQREQDHFIRCAICGERIDCCDLGQGLDHLHGQQIEEAPTI